MNKVYVKYDCNKCDFTTIDKTKFNRYLQSKRHMVGKSPCNYECTCCGLKTKNKTVYINHLGCPKHKRIYAKTRLKELYQVIIADDI